MKVPSLICFRGNTKMKGSNYIVGVKENFSIGFSSRNAGLRVGKVSFLAISLMFCFFLKINFQRNKGVIISY